MKQLNQAVDNFTSKVGAYLEEQTDLCVIITGNELGDSGTELINLQVEQNKQTQESHDYAESLGNSIEIINTNKGKLDSGQLCFIENLLERLEEQDVEY